MSFSKKIYGGSRQALPPLPNKAGLSKLFIPKIEKNLDEIKQLLDNMFGDNTIEFKKEGDTKLVIVVKYKDEMISDVNKRFQASFKDFKSVIVQEDAKNLQTTYILDQPISNEANAIDSLNKELMSGLKSAKTP